MKFSVPEKEVEAIYFSDEEISKLFQLDLSLCKRLDKVRDFARVIVRFLEQIGTTASN